MSNVLIAERNAFVLCGLLQDSISEKVAGALMLKLTGEEQRLLTKRYTDNPEAYRLYQLGQYHYDKRRVDDIEKAISYFEQAVALDSKYALAYAALRNSYASLSYLGALPAKEVIPKASAALARALEIDDQLAEAHAALASNKQEYDWDWSGAEKEYKRAVELNPSSASIHNDYAWYLMTAGHFDEAVAEAERAQELDPLSQYNAMMAGQILFFARRYDEAIQASQRALDMDPNLGQAHLWIGNSYEQEGNYDKVIEAYTSHHGGSAIRELREAYAASGWKGFWQKMLGRAKEASKGDYVPAYNFASIHARLGDRDQVFIWLNKACEERDLYILALNVNPIWDSYRSDPRFSALLHRVGLK